MLKKIFRKKFFCLSKRRNNSWSRRRKFNSLHNVRAERKEVSGETWSAGDCWRVFILVTMWQVSPISSTFFSQNFGKLLLINVWVSPALIGWGSLVRGAGEREVTRSLHQLISACEKHEINEKISLVIRYRTCAGNFYFHIATLSS